MNFFLQMISLIFPEIKFTKHFLGHLTENLKLYCKFFIFMWKSLRKILVNYKFHHLADTSQWKEIMF